MKKLFTFCLLVLTFSSLLHAFTPIGEISKETFIFSIKDNDTLRLDKYDIATSSVTEQKPCIIFMFGGGFSSGNRDKDFKYMHQLVQSGYVAISIDYRLGMKNQHLSENAELMELVSLMGNSIYIAVEDLFDATKFVLDHAKDWNINKDLIIANGSSAGAVAVLQAEYDICNKGQLSAKLPDNFNYAGVIAFAGAIFSTNGDLQWKTNPAPIQMFHGDADSNVPYNKLELFNIGLYGSKHIASKLSELESPYYFYDVRNAAHEIAGNPMTDNLPEINSFIKNLILEKKAWKIHSIIDEIGKPEMKKDFEILDYLKANYM